MVHVGYARHRDEGEVMQEPAHRRVQTGVIDVVHVGEAEFIVAALPADEVPDEDHAEDAEAGGAAPVDEGVAEEEVFDDAVVPRTHAETDVEDWPLPELRSEVVLFVWVGDEGVV